jgi:hypothetical protein
VIIASALEDTRTINSGGIWRSTDGGISWQKPTTSNPPAGCTTPPGRASTWGISFPPRIARKGPGQPVNQDVYVGTDCGVAVSHDLGATWSHVSLSRTWSVVAGAGGLPDIVDTCSNDGHHRSTDGGRSFGPANPIPGGNCQGFFVHAIAASPFESKVLFAATGFNSLFEGHVSDNGAVTWTNLNPPTAGPSKAPWVKTHRSADGIASHFDLYFGSGANMVRQTCTNSGGAGLRCSTSWTNVTVDHADQNDLAFSTSGNCPQLWGSDGGMHKTSDCGASWTITGGGSAGYNALQLYEVNGQVHLDHTDLYMGTQDNSIWASADSGATWGNELCCEGFHIQVPHTSPTDAGQTVTGADCADCVNFRHESHLAGPRQPNGRARDWINPPGGGGNPFLIDFPDAPQGTYVQYSQPCPPDQPTSILPTSVLYLTTRIPSSQSDWRPLTAVPFREPFTGQCFLLGNMLIDQEIVDRPYIAGPGTVPTIYSAYKKRLMSAGPIPGSAPPAAKNGLLRIDISGLGPTNASVDLADNGLDSISFYNTSFGSLRSPLVFAVDPNNSQHLIAADAGTNEMKVSIDGGASWTVDTALTKLVTGDGEFLFSQPYFPNYSSQAHVIAFDPLDGNRILVGTEAAGIIFSLDSGQTWDTVPGSNHIPNITSFFFGDAGGSTGTIPRPVLVSSYGRGLWRLSLPLSTPGSSVPSGLLARQTIALRPAIQAAQQVLAAPYLRLFGTIPITGQTTALSGDQVTAYGSAFCPNVNVFQCSPLTLQVGDRIAVEQVPVANDGTFRVTFTVTELPGYYTVTASQFRSDGSTLTDSARLIVPVGDVAEVTGR